MDIRENLLEKFQELDYLFEKLDWLDENEPTNETGYCEINTQIVELLDQLTKEEQMEYFSQID